MKNPDGGASFGSIAVFFFDAGEPASATAGSTTSSSRTTTLGGTALTTDPGGTLEAAFDGTAPSDTGCTVDTPFEGNALPGTEVA